MRAADPTVRGSVIAETLGVSRQRVDQILRSEGLVTKGKAKIGIEHRAEYLCWWNMLDRCLNPACKTFKYYGARGITVCQRWRDFGRFLDDMGPRPSPTRSIDRKDNDGNYEPANCHWATRTQQAQNRRGSKMTTAIKAQIIQGFMAGETQKSLAARFGFANASYISRLLSGVDTSKRVREHFGHGRPPKWELTNHEREIIEGIWSSRRYKNDDERTVAVRKRTGKKFSLSWLRLTFGSPHKRSNKD